MKITSLNGPPEDGSVVSEIVWLICALEDRSPVDVEPPLYDAVDPTALEALSAAGGGDGDIDGRVRFTYRGYEVTVTTDRRVTVERLAPGADGAVTSSAPVRE